MEKSTLHQKINLRAELLKIELKNWGQKNKYRKENAALFVNKTIINL
tara:strand:- start:658 stop:798 length:141 start_codon:yes stop_codon:yes gene_type:complete